MRYCVIGGAGFIGAHVTRILAASGRDVTVLGRRPRPTTALPDGVSYLAGDYGTISVLRAALADVDAVVDLAYSTVPKTSFEDPVFDIVSNLPASVQLLREAVSAGVRKVVVVSSGGTIYGIAESLPIREDHPTNPISPYGITKLTIEKYAGMYGIASGLPVVVVRPGNAYGEGQHAIGQGFVAAAMRAIIRREPIGVFGSGETIRDYVHVSDVASGILAALDVGAPGEAYNVGTGVGRRILDVLSEIKPHARAAGFDVRTATLPERSFDVPANVLDSGKLAEISGWKPMIDFTHGVEQMWRSLLDDLPL